MRVACGAHVREFVRALFAEVIELAGNYDLRLSRQECHKRFPEVEVRAALGEINESNLSTGILTEPEEEMKRRLTQPATVLMKLPSDQTES